MPDETTFFTDVELLIEERYKPLADHARRTGLTMSADFLSHLVRVEIETELHELSVAMTSPHPRHLSEIVPGADSGGHDA